MTIGDESIHSVLAAIAKVDGKLDLVVQRLDGHGRVIQDHESRIRTVEASIQHALTREVYADMETTRNEAAAKRRTQTVAIVSVIAAIIVPLLVALGNWISTHW